MNNNSTHYGFLFKINNEYSIFLGNIDNTVIFEDNNIKTYFKGLSNRKSD